MSRRRRNEGEVQLRINHPERTDRRFFMPGTDPEGRRLPIKLDSTSNGEFVPVPLSPANLAANRLAHEAASANAKRLGPDPKKIPGFGLRRRQHPARLQRGERRRGTHGRLLRPAAGSGARPAARARAGRAGEGRVRVRRAGPLRRHAEGQLRRARTSSSRTCSWTATPTSWCCPSCPPAATPSR